MPRKIKSFKQAVWQHYMEHGRQLPWRDNLDPYAILVSELMLQQTQVDRVIPKYNEFLKVLPTFAALHRATLKDVLLAWQGLGYNRRAALLKKAATTVVEHYKGKLPTSVDALEELPGVGPYTARAIAVFAFNQPHVLIETNIRAVFIHTFFNKGAAVSDQQLLPLLTQTVDQQRPREWYWALMDYGSYLKKQFPNPGRSSAHYVKQSTFQNSNRQLRGQILKLLARNKPLTARKLITLTKFSPGRVKESLSQLSTEGLITKRGQYYFLG